MMLSQSMFEHLSSGSVNVGPTPAELAEQALEAQRTQKVKLKEYKVKLYSLIDEKQREEYCVDMQNIIAGIALRTHVLFNHGREFVTTPVPTWIVSLEWGEFELITEIIQPIKSQG